MDDQERLNRRRARQNTLKNKGPQKAGKAQKEQYADWTGSDQEKPDLKKRIIKELLETSIYLLVVLIFTYLAITFIGQRTEVSGSSMESTLSDKDNLIVDKITYRFSDPKRYDIVVFPYEYADNTYYIKRIIGMPGETIRIDYEGNIYIDEEILHEDYGREVMDSPGRAYEPIDLGPDEYFVLGDNRNNSSDSRDPTVGNIKRSELIGRAFVRVWPFSKAGILRHQ